MLEEDKKSDILKTSAPFAMVILSATPTQPKGHTMSDLKDPVTYSMGFAVSTDGQRVLLLEKARPAFLAGQWIGVGGHIEEGETPLEAMIREAKEEADLDVTDWTYLDVVGQSETPGAPKNSALIYMFVARADLSQAQALTEERVVEFSWQETEQLPLAQSTRMIIDRVKEFAQASSVPRLKF